MRRYLQISALLTLAASLGLASIDVQATPTTVNLSGCGGSLSCTNEGVTFTGWQYDPIGPTWANTALTYKADANNETGLGVACTSGPKCGENEINGTPVQLIATDLSGIRFSTLSLSVGSVDCNGSTNCSDPEIAYIYGATCAQPLSCIATALDSYTGMDYPGNAHTFTFTAGELTGYDFLWVTPYVGGPANDANILLQGLSYNSVPEPAALGMFGLGALLIGLFAGLRRRFD